MDRQMALLSNHHTFRASDELLTLVQIQRSTRYPFTTTNKHGRDINHHFGSHRVPKPTRKTRFRDSQIQNPGLQVEFTTTIGPDRVSIAVDR